MTQGEGCPWKEWIRRILRHDAHPGIQFIKYAVAGGVATGVDMAVFYLLAWWVFPALNSEDIVVQILGLDAPVIEEVVRSRHFVINNALAFLFSNLTAYLMNIAWVFTPGRHRRDKEVFLFYLVSAVSLGAGTLLGWVMIRFLGLSTTASYLAKMFASLMINYACRKFLVFRG